MRRREEGTMKEKRKKKMTAKTVSRYVFILPGMCFFVFAVIIPFLMGFQIAFSDWNGITKDFNMVGMKNFMTLIRDRRILSPIKNTLIFAVIGTVGNTVICLGTALLVNRKTGYLGNIAKIVFFIPVCFSSVLSAFLWKFLYREVFSELFHIKNLLGNQQLVIPAITLIGLWNTCGINMLVYLAGLKNIPKDLYEAATIDGAGTMSKFINVTLPLLSPSFTACVTIALTSWLKEFALTLASTGGGPGGASKTISIYIYDNLYTYSKAGYGQAISLVFVVVLIIAGNLVTSFFRKREVEM